MVGVDNHGHPRQAWLNFLEQFNPFAWQLFHVLARHPSQVSTWTRKTCDQTIPTGSLMLLRIMLL